jgi:hypothetical protein
MRSMRGALMPYISICQLWKVSPILESDLPSSNFGNRQSWRSPTPHAFYAWWWELFPEGALIGIGNVARGEVDKKRPVTIAR